MSDRTDRPSSFVAPSRRPHRSTEPAHTVDLGSLSYRDALEHVRAEGITLYLQQLLQRFDGNVPDAAAHAEIERESFYRLCRRHGVDPADYRIPRF